MKKSIVTKSLVASLGLGLLAAAGTASAEPVLRDVTVNATGYCQAALPAYETSLRKRPTAIRNEGAANAFVSCSLPGDYFNVGGNYFAAVTFANAGASVANVSCTFVDGLAAPWQEGGPVYRQGAVNVQPGTVNYLVWEPGAEEAFSANANFSCSLPPGVEIHFIEIQFEEDNGVESAPTRG